MLTQTFTFGSTPARVNAMIAGLAQFTSSSSGTSFEIVSRRDATRVGLFGGERVVASLVEIKITTTTRKRLDITRIFISTFA